MGIFVHQDKCCQIYNNGLDLELRIIGEHEYVTVARFPSQLNGKLIREFDEFKRSLIGWFRGEPYRQKYLEEVLNGNADPLETWEIIKRDYGLSDNYDVRE
jgi:hypothetical protein